jgi:branched-chain amino acid transport system substrate-binding protein
LATSDALGDLGEGVFRLVPGNREQGRILAGWALRTMRATTGIIYYVTDEYGASLRDGIHEAFIEGGGEILDGVPILEAMDLDLEGLVRQSLSRGTPDVVFLAVRADAAALLIEEIERFGVEPIYLTGDGASNEEVIRSRVRPAAWERFHRARFWHPDASASGDFPARWERIFGRAPTDAQVVELDAAWTLVEAMREVGPQPGAIREFLTSLGRDRPTLTGTAGPIEFTRGFSGGFVLVRSSRDSVVARMWDRDNP